ncbi:hypothetical protein J1N35_026118 [Gossypium stocksii]|uniref:Reverse transcriptase zinc-binding domain-containing protein n=1 Tax=Gossypium stocksii TaxID=47602 RepID=A0A9D3V867_9ROSI|nr:hypothetical protein J1N35_026118 [Gossypium stocksii]
MSVVGFKIMVDDAKKGIIWIVWNGQLVNFWNDDWVRELMINEERARRGGAIKRWAYKSITVNSWQNSTVGWIKINVDGLLPMCGLKAAINDKAREPSSD